MAKTIKNEFDKYLTYDNLMKCHQLSRNGKTLKREVVLFDLKKEEYIQWLLERLQTETYEHGGYRKFYVYVPKKRKVEASRYMDRIVHRWIVDYFLKPYFENQFIYTTYACIRGKGMHKAAVDVQNAMKHCKRIWQDYYILKMDVRKYFENIDKQTLVKILQRKVNDEKLMNLLNKIIFSQVTEKGLPIGNYTSQTFANIYLNEIDQYAKHELKCKYYFRYMDDTIILLKTKKETIKILEQITKFLKENLKLELNSKTQIFKSKQGVNFCGYKINEYRMKLRDRGKRSLKKKVKKLEEKVINGEMSTKEAHKYLAGHMGYIKYANAKNLTEKLFVT